VFAYARDYWSREKKKENTLLRIGETPQKRRGGKKGGRRYSLYYFAREKEKGALF